MSTNQKYSSENSSQSLQLLDDIAGKLTFGDLLRSERERLGWTMKDLGEKLGVNRQYINNLEKGVKIPSVEQAVRFAEAVGKSPEIYIELVFQNVLDRTSNLKDYKVFIAKEIDKKRA